jgi:hypothetical protein
MTRWSFLETDEERSAREARAEAFWKRSDSETFSDLILPEEDLPPERRGGMYRWFRSPNVLDLVKARAGRLGLC